MRRCVTPISRFGLLLCSIGMSNGIIRAEETTSAGGGGIGRRTHDRFSFVPVPYPYYNRTLGLSVGALPMAMFSPVEHDTLSPSPLAGVLGMYTTNRTFLLMDFTRISLDEGNQSVTLAGGSGSFKFSFHDRNMVQEVAVGIEDPGVYFHMGEAF